MEKCKDCFFNFKSEDLIHHAVGYPYCKPCFENISLHNKKKFINKYSRDNEFIKNSIKNSESLCELVLKTFLDNKD